MADSSLFDIDSSLPDLNELLQTRWARLAVATASAAPSGAPLAAPFRKLGDSQSNPIELFDTPPPRQTVPTPSHEVTQGPSWLRKPWFTVQNRPAASQVDVQASAEEPFPTLPPPGTPPYTRRKHRAASAASEHYTTSPLLPWLQSPLPEVEIERLEWKPNPRLHLDLVPVVKKVVNSMPAQHLLEPYTGEIFEDINAAFNRYQDYAFSKGFFIVKLSVSGLDTLRPRTIFVCKHHGEHTRNYRKLDDFRGENSNRQREATKVHQMRCGWTIRVAWKQLIKYIGLVYRWVATLTYAKYGNPDNPEARPYDFITNPLTYIGH